MLYVVKFVTVEFVASLYKKSFASIGSELSKQKFCCRHRKYSPTCLNFNEKNLRGWIEGSVQVMDLYEQEKNVFVSKQFSSFKFLLPFFVSAHSC